MPVNALAQLDGQIEGRDYGKISQTLSVSKPQVALAMVDSLGHVRV